MCQTALGTLIIALMETCGVTEMASCDRPCTRFRLALGKGRKL
jgi:hypothetical protein